MKARVMHKMLFVPHTFQFFTDQAQKRCLTMIFQNIIEILMDLHEVSSNPMRTVYENCLNSMENVSNDISSVDSLPNLPFTRPIKSKIKAAITNNKGDEINRREENNIETDVETSTDTAERKQSSKRKRRKRPKNTGYVDESISNSESSIGFGVPKRKKAINVSTSSSASSLPDPSIHNIKCNQCSVWIDTLRLREHKKNHCKNQIPPPTRSRNQIRTSTSSRNQIPPSTWSRTQRPDRIAKNAGPQRPEYLYY